MKQKVLKIVFPVVSGMFAIILTLLLVYLIVGNNTLMNEQSKHFFMYYSHISILIAFLMQIFIVTPLFCKLNFESTKNKLLVLTCIVAFSIIASLLFSFLVATPKTLPYDFLITAFYCFLFMTIYWTVNIHIMLRLCKPEE